MALILTASDEEKMREVGVAACRTVPSQFLSHVDATIRHDDIAERIEEILSPG
jgi:hypothetical protein